MKHVLAAPLASPFSSPSATSFLSKSRGPCHPLPSVGRLSHILAAAGAPSGRFRTVACSARLDAARKSSRREKQAGSFLRTIRGVGKVNESKLLQQGLDSLESLQDVYVKECGADEEEAIKYLRAKVGIRQKRHCESIVQFVRAQLHDRRVTLCVEGNISAGKSTFLGIVRGNNEELRDSLQVVPEPVDRWQAAHYGNTSNRRQVNLLETYYQDPDNTAYVFQTYVFLTRVFQETSTRCNPERFRLMERSVFSDRMVFVRKLQADAFLNPEQLGVYDGMFEPLVRNMTSLVPDGFIYLRAQPQTCMRRMKKRSRSEEDGVAQDYLEGLHANHEDWLHPSLQDSPAPLWMDRDVNMTLAPLNHTLALRGNPSSSDRPDAPACIRDNLKWVYAKTVPLVMDTLRQVPVLVLEMDQDLDLDRDVGAKQQLSNKVAAYFKYVQECKDARRGGGPLLAVRPEEARAVAKKMADPDAARRDMKMEMMRGHEAPKTTHSTEALVEELVPRPYAKEQLAMHTDQLVRHMPQHHVAMLFSLLNDTLQDRSQVPSLPEHRLLGDLRDCIAESHLQALV